ncbi:MAG: tRNA(His) guanylyltransferase Thg1 family protein [Phycisphaerales bacterium]
MPRTQRRPPRPRPPPRRARRPRPPRTALARRGLRRTLLRLHQPRFHLQRLPWRTPEGRAHEVRRPRRPHAHLRDRPRPPRPARPPWSHASTAAPFTRLTKERHNFQAPFDERFRDMMLATCEHLMACGPRLLYAYTQSDEISLLFHPDADDFSQPPQTRLGPRRRGQRPVPASCWATSPSSTAASANSPPAATWPTTSAGDRKTPTATASTPTATGGSRGEDAHRRQAAERVGLSVAEKNELLFQRGQNFNDLPPWQRRGMGVLWQDIQKQGLNPVTGQTTLATRRQLSRLLDLPMRDEYDAFIERVLAESQPGTP